MGKRVDETVLLVLDRDPQLVAFLAVWHHCVEEGCLVSRVARVLLGETFPVARIYERALILGLLNDDGSIHDHARYYLRSKTTEILLPFQRAREAAPGNQPQPETPRGSDGQDETRGEPE